MKIKGIYFFVCLILLASHASAQTDMIAERNQALRKNEPIEIVADKMEAYQEKKTIVFSGNAVARQGDITLKTDRLTVYYKRAEGKTEKVAGRELQTAGDLDRIEAGGNVIITQKDLSATGEEAVYSHAAARFVMTGRPVLKQGENTVSGCKVIIYVNENRGEVVKCEGEDAQRVTAIIHPQGKNNPAPVNSQDAKGK
jgi:lipopolysaccharide export system protein LptA